MKRTIQNRSPIFWAAVQIFAASVFLFSGVHAQQESENEVTYQRLADIRFGLNELFFKLQGLRLEQIQINAELSPTAVDSSSLLSRIDNLENELRIYISRIEVLEFRINEIAAEGIFEIKELRNQLEELENSNTNFNERYLPDLPLVDDLANQDIGDRQPLPSAPDANSMFDSALKYYFAGEYEQAYNEFRLLLTQYPATVYRSKSFYYVGETLIALGRKRDAIVAFLDSIVADVTGEYMPVTLLRLGQVFALELQYLDACNMFSTIVEQYPDTGQATQAELEWIRNGCSDTTSK